ncbi:MAG: hydroxymethylbilane synthase [Dehalococcoidia bacterium]|nr:hydroxymethylbilane synthase [Dehalococcoidia bacterium]
MGSRGSKLAVLQAELVIERLKRCHPGREYVIKTVKTTGDRQLQADLAEIGGQGVFVKELELALSNREVDLAVHSLKDVPTQLGEGLTLAAILEREDVRDVLVSKSGQGLARLPRGACLGTGSQRRAVQLKAFRPDLVIRSIRGNIDTRLKKAFSDELDGVILAGAALARLGWQDRVTEYLPTELSLPMVGQGALAVEVRADDDDTRAMVSVLIHEATERSTTAERAFLRALGGGCAAPIAALGTVTGEVLRLEGMAASTDGCHIIRAWHTGAPADAEVVGKALGEKILDMGARQFIEKVER